MRTLVWILVWIALVVVAGLYLWRAVRVAWGQTTALGSELATASDRLAQVQTQVDRLGEANDRLDELAVFGDPVVLRRERAQGRETLRRQGRDNRRRALPTWARHVDS
ncbi:hypothetical protein V3N99_00775 [Dermatophilaceae bacterium Soc4.6]|uniref:hypothetical protein n=1 Tax=Lapillicoccus sp. TaxID=1909287 RepID=UPI00326226D2